MSRVKRGREVGTDPAPKKAKPLPTPEQAHADALATLTRVEAEFTKSPVPALVGLCPETDAAKLRDAGFLPTLVNELRTGGPALSRDKLAALMSAQSAGMLNGIAYEQDTDYLNYLAGRRLSSEPMFSHFDSRTGGKKRDVQRVPFYTALGAIAQDEVGDLAPHTLSHADFVARRAGLKEAAAAIHAELLKIKADPDHVFALPKAITDKYDVRVPADLRELENVREGYVGPALAVGTMEVEGGKPLLTFGLNNQNVVPADLHPYLADDGEGGGAITRYDRAMAEVPSGDREKLHTAWNQRRGVVGSHAEVSAVGHLLDEAGAPAEAAGEVSKVSLYVVATGYDEAGTYTPGNALKEFPRCIGCYSSTHGAHALTEGRLPVGKGAKQERVPSPADPPPPPPGPLPDPLAGPLAMDLG